MILFLVIYLLGAIGFFIHLYSIPPEHRTKTKIIELLLLYQLVFAVGITSFLAFIGLNFLSHLVAEHMNWPSCPYQQELANVNLAYGVLGILAIWFRQSFWTCIVIGFTIWIFGDGIHHLYDAYAYNNFSAGNVGFLVYTDLIIPVLLCINLYFYLKTEA